MPICRAFIRRCPADSRVHKKEGGDPVPPFPSPLRVRTGIIDPRVVPPH